jgi:hypothetical protein
MMNGTPQCPPFLPERDFVGYGWDTPANCWPNGAKIAVNFVVNFEEYVPSVTANTPPMSLTQDWYLDVRGGESTLANGDEYSEGYLHEAFHKTPLKGKRDQQLETMVSAL